MTKSSKPVVIITGVSSGIGLETAKLFSSKGWLVVGTVRGREFPEELATHAVDTQIAEMRRPVDLGRVVERTIKTYGRIDVLVANAGYGLWGKLSELSFEQITAQFEVNVVAVAELIRLVLPVMRRAGKGVVIAVSSVVGQIGLPEAPAYAASKQGLEGLIESLWLDESSSGFRWRLVEPGPIDSPFWKNRLTGGNAKPIKLADSRLSKPRYRLPGGVRVESSTRRVAEVVYEAAVSPADRLRYPVGSAVRGLSWAKRLLPEALFGRLMRRYYKETRSKN